MSDKKVLPIPFLKTLQEDIGAQPFRREAFHTIPHFQKLLVKLFKILFKDNFYYEIPAVFV